MAKSKMPDKMLRKIRARPANECSRSPQSKGLLKAQYGNSRMWRIVYVANGRWQLEKFTDAKIEDRKAERLWHSVCRPASYEIAKAQLQGKDRASA